MFIKQVMLFSVLLIVPLTRAGDPVVVLSTVDEEASASNFGNFPADVWRALIPCIAHGMNHKDVFAMIAKMRRLSSGFNRLLHEQSLLESCASRASSPYMLSGLQVPSELNEVTSLAVGRILAGSLMSKRERSFLQLLQRGDCTWQDIFRDIADSGLVSSEELLKSPYLAEVCLLISSMPIDLYSKAFFARYLSLLCVDKAFSIQFFPRFLRLSEKLGMNISQTYGVSIDEIESILCSTPATEERSTHLTFVSLLSLVKSYSVDTCADLLKELRSHYVLSENQSQLFEACINGDVILLQQLMEDRSAKRIDDVTICVMLLYTLQRGHAECAKYIIGHVKDSTFEIVQLGVYHYILKIALKFADKDVAVLLVKAFRGLLEDAELADFLMTGQLRGLAMEVNTSGECDTFSALVNTVWSFQGKPPVSSRFFQACLAQNVLACQTEIDSLAEESKFDAIWLALILAIKLDAHQIVSLIRDDSSGIGSKAFIDFKNSLLEVAHMFASERAESVIREVVPIEISVHMQITGQMQGERNLRDKGSVETFINRLMPSQRDLILLDAARRGDLGVVLDCLASRDTLPWLLIDLAILAALDAESEPTVAALIDHYPLPELNIPIDMIEAHLRLSVWMMILALRNQYGSLLKDLMIRHCRLTDHQAFQANKLVDFKICLHSLLPVLESSEQCVFLWEAFSQENIPLQPPGSLEWFLACFDDNAEALKEYEVEFDYQDGFIAQVLGWATATRRIHVFRWINTSVAGKQIIRTNLPLLMQLAQARGY